MIWIWHICCRCHWLRCCCWCYSANHEHSILTFGYILSKEHLLTAIYEVGLHRSRPMMRHIGSHSGALSACNWSCLSLPCDLYDRSQCVFQPIHEMTSLFRNHRYFSGFRAWVVRFPCGLLSQQNYFPSFSLLFFSCIWPDWVCEFGFLFGLVGLSARSIFGPYLFIARKFCEQCARTNSTQSSCRTHTHRPKSPNRLWL